MISVPFLLWVVRTDNSLFTTPNKCSIFAP